MKKVLLVLSIALFCTPLFAQKKFEGTPVNSEASRAARQVFSKYRLFNFDLPAIRTYLQSAKGPTKTIELSLPGYESFVLELGENDILSANYSATIAGEKGKINYGRPDRVLTLTGRVKGETTNHTTLTVTDNLVFGSIRKGGKEYFIEPLKGIDPGASGNSFVIYETKDVIATTPLTCGATEVTERSNASANNETARATGACKVVELAIASDSSMLQKYGDANTLLERNIAVVNGMIGIYKDAQFTNPSSYLEFKIAKQYVSTSVAADPISPAYSGRDADTLLRRFAAWGKGPSHFGVEFDIGQLWTARNLSFTAVPGQSGDSSVVGFANIGAICGTDAFEVLEDIKFVAGEVLVGLATHETGHILGASHDNDNAYIMSPSLGRPPATTFSAASISAISAELASVTCLAACNAQAPVAQFSVPVSMCLGNTVQLTDASMGQVTSRTWSFPGGSPSSSSSDSVAVTYTTPGIKSVTLSVSNASGTGSITKSFLVSSPPAALASSCKTTLQDVAPNQPVLYGFSFGNFSSNLGSYRTNGNYYDFACTGNTLAKAGATYTASAEIGFLPFGGDSRYDTKLDVFLDLNNDADFADAGEKLYASATCTQGTISFPLTFPANPPVYNQFLRLRLVAHTCASSVTDACNIPPSSVVVDYAVAILPANPSLVLYVDSSREQSGDGSSWLTSINQLSQALAIAKQYPSVSEIRVAKGTYLPTSDGNPDTSFVLRGGLKLYGGYPSGGAGPRNAAANPAVLSGDLGVPGNNGDNSYHVVVIAGLGSNSDSLVVDGFIVRDGNANVTGIGGKNYNGVVVNPYDGGGVALVQNAAGQKIAFRNCLFAGNNGSQGGGMYNLSSSSSIANCTFAGNSSPDEGGGMYNIASSPALTNCVFAGNSSSADGGGIHNFASSPSITNCIFAGNSSPDAWGGGMYNQSSAPSVTNCTFAGNGSSQGGGVYNDNSSSATITNCILWGNTASSGVAGIYNEPRANANITYSTVQDSLYPGTGNLSSNPLFVNPADPDGPDNVFGTADDGVRLSCASSAINKGDSSAVSGIATDITGAARIQSSTVDMGAYESSYGMPATPSVTIAANPGKTVCKGVNVTFTASPVNGGTAPAYQWNKNGLGVGTNSNTYSASDLANGDTITVQLTGSGACAYPATATDTVRVTVNPLSAPTSFSAAACNTYTLPWGTAVTASGDYAHTYVNRTGCDSVVTAHVTINRLVGSEQSVTACESYNWNGTVYTTSGDKTKLFPGGSAAGCDSTALLHLTIGHANTGEQTVSACNSYSLPWGGSVTASGNYTHHYTNVSGCDSLLTVHLTILTPPPAGTVSYTANSLCVGAGSQFSASGAAGGSWSSNNQTVAKVSASGLVTGLAAGSALITYTVSNSCGANTASATVTVNALPAKPVITAGGPTTFYTGGSVSLSAPAGFAAYQWNNNATTQSITVSTGGSYSVVVTNANGCKSPVSDPVAVTVQFSLLTLSHLDGDYSQPANNLVRPYLQLNNEGPTPVAYKDVTIRYWLTVEDFAPMTNLFIDWAQVGTSKVKMKYVKLPQPRQDAYGYIEYSFDATAGNLAAGSNSGPIQTRAGKSDWTSFNEANDYSYAPAAAYTKNSRITVYQNGNRVWGTEPAAVSPIQSLKGYSQDKSSGATTNTLSPWLKLNNEGNVPVSYADITMRYWFTADGTQPLNYYLDYAQIGSSNVKYKFVKLSAALPTADTYLELSFSAADSLYPISSTGNIQQRIAKSDWSNFNQLNDHSFKAGSTMSENTKLTVYVKGTLVYGTEPVNNATTRTLENKAVAVSGKLVDRLAQKAPMTKGLKVTVLNNPVAGNMADLMIEGAEGRPLRISLLDAQGRVLIEQHWSRAAAEQRASLPLGSSAAQLFFARVSTSTETTTVKLVKAD